MKITKTVYITDPVDFVRGNHQLCFGIYPRDFFSQGPPDGWVECGEVEFDAPDVGVHQAAIDALDNKAESIRQEFKKDMARIDNAKAELIALPGVRK